MGPRIGPLNIICQHKLCLWQNKHNALSHPTTLFRDNVKIKRLIKKIARIDDIVASRTCQQNFQLYKLQILLKVYTIDKIATLYTIYII